LVWSQVAGFFSMILNFFQDLCRRFLNLGHRDFLMIQVLVVVIVLGSFLNVVYVPRFVFKFSGIGSNHRSEFPIFRLIL
jgi:hypothetical protein